MAVSFCRQNNKGKGLDSNAKMMRKEQYAHMRKCEHTNFPWHVSVTFADDGTEVSVVLSAAKDRLSSLSFFCHGKLAASM